MNKLSRTAHTYIANNRLEGFVSKGVPARELSLTINLFDKSLLSGTLFRFPDDETLKEMRKFECKEKKRIRLKKIEYRCESTSDKNTLIVNDQND